MATDHMNPMAISFYVNFFLARLTTKQYAGLICRLQKSNMAAVTGHYVKHNINTGWFHQAIIEDIFGLDTPETYL